MLNTIRLSPITLLFITLFITASCLPEDAGLPKRLDLNFMVNDVGTTVVRNTDSLNVNEFKLLLDKFILDTGGDARLETNINNLVLRYRAINSGLEEDILTTNFGFDFNTFNGIQIFVQPAETEGEVQDRDFFQDQEAFSVIVKGEYNSTDFEYRSNITFDKLMDFPLASLTDNEETLKVLLLNDISTVFIDPQTDEIISPLTDNNSKIDSLIESSFQVQAQAVSAIPLN